MRTSNVTIDGVDIFQTYDAIIIKDGYRELFQWPTLKAVSGNDWQEEDGFEPDLSEPRLDSRELTITFGCKGGAGKVKDFYDFLISKPVMEYSFANIGRSLMLRVVSMPSLQYAEKFEVLAVRFACDDPLAGYTYAAPSSSLPENRDYVLDGVALSDYGVRTLLGTVEGTLRRPDVKPLLTRNNSVIDGAEYDQNPTLNDADGSMSSEDYVTVGSTMEGVSGSWKRKKAGGSVTTRARDITLTCVLSAPTLANLWQNYNALLYNLTKKDANAEDSTLAGARTIIIRAVGGSFQCFYKSMQVLDYYLGDGVYWVEFNLTLTLFSETYSGGGGGGGGSQLFFLLSSEDGGFIITEDGKLIPLDLA